jgi:hypothetical protein
LDVFYLRALVATAHQDEDRISLRLEVNALSGSMVNAEFTDSLAHRRYIASVTEG